MRYMPRVAVEPWGSRRRCSGLASRDARSSPPSNHDNHFVFFVSEDVFASVDAAAAPEEPPRRRSCNRPTPLRKHATLTNHNDNICTPVYASNVSTFPISTAPAAASAAATNPLVVSRSLGTAAAEPPQPADCIAMAARDISYGADGVLLLCESLLQHLLVSEPDAGVIVYGSAYLRVLCKHYSCTFARPVSYTHLRAHET